MERVLFLVRSNKPFGTQRRDLDYIIENLTHQGYFIDIYDPKQKILMRVKEKTIENYNIFPKWIFVSKFYLILNFLTFIRFLKRNQGAYAIVHAFYLREEYLIVPKLVRGLGNRLFLSLFGSDINIRTVVKKRFKKLYALADVVTATTEEFGRRANAIIGQDLIKQKLRILVLPQDHYNLYRDHALEYKTACKLKMNFNLKKKCILIGTNSTENEQHEKMITALAKISNPADYILVFPLSNRFGNVNEREIMLEKLISKELRNFEVKIYKEFVSYETMRDLRFASDIFINCRIKDQLTGAMIESNLSYTRIITGSWLPYKDYCSKIKVVLVDSIDFITSKIESLSSGECISDQELVENKRKAISLYDTGILNQWLSLYTEC